jgi:hypothetical protein
MGGIAYYGSGSSYSAFLSNAPGVAPSYRGNVERTQGLALVSQNELNTLVGNVFAQRNVIYPNVDIQMAGNYRNFDIAPQEKVPVTVASTDTVRGIAFTAKNFYLNRMEWSYDPSKEIFLPRLGLIELGSGFAGDTIVIPDVPDVESGGFNEPTITVPQITIPPYPTLRGGSGLPTWVPALTAFDTADRYPKYSDMGAIEVGGAVDGPTFKLVVAFPSMNEGSVDIYAVYYWAGFSVSYGTNCEARAWSLPGLTNVVTDTFTGTVSHVAPKWAKEFKMTLSWSGESVGLITANYILYPFAFGIYLAGFVLDWD